LGPRTSDPPEISGILAGLWSMGTNPSGPKKNGPANPRQSPLFLPRHPVDLINPPPAGKWPPPRNLPPAHLSGTKMCLKHVGSGPGSPLAPLSQKREAPPPPPKLLCPPVAPWLPPLPHGPTFLPNHSPLFAWKKPPSLSSLPPRAPPPPARGRQQAPPPGATFHCPPAAPGLCFFTDPISLPVPLPPVPPRTKTPPPFAMSLPPLAAPETFFP